jgi:tetratricopeptide (TPR) repeat protein
VYGGRDHPVVSGSLHNLGIAYANMGDYRKAIEYYEKTLAMLERVFPGRDHPRIVSVLRNLANAQEKAGNASEAAAYRKRASAMQQRLKGRPAVTAEALD